jgi:hypothetical protein
VKKKYFNGKGQFLIIAALLVAVVLVTALMATYSLMRNSPFETSPQALDAVNEIDLALKNLLDYTVGYYCSILQVSGNRTYAQGLATNYLSSGLASIANEYPQWNPSFTFSSSNIGIRWFNPTSYSGGNLSVTYSLAKLGITNINYSTSSKLNAVFNTASATQTRITVTEENGQPLLTLVPQEFSFLLFNNYSSAWTTVHPSSAPAFGNGTYVVSIPSGVDYSTCMVQISDSRGIMVTLSRLFYYTYTLTWNPTLYSSLKNDVMVVEALQNGSLRWLGQNLLTNGKPIPPVPVKALHVNETVNGVNRQVPFQVEYWASNYRVPQGLASNASVFSSGDMLVFLVNHNVQSVTFWWDGRDTVAQTSYAWINRYFKDNPANNVLFNGILNLTVGNFIITATLGSASSSTQFLRINGLNPSYGSASAYVIYNGIVRDIVQQEAEWSGGILTSSGATANCPNVYSQIYLALPANATYYTYSGRLMFLNSSQSRTIKDLSVIQLSVSGGSLSQLTENGTSGGYPVSSNVAGQFYNFTTPSFQTGWAHHWSEFISSGSSGAGIMFPDNSNRKLYTFDSVAGHKTGALNVSSSSKVIEFDPLDPRSQYPASFTYPLDVTWSGAIVTFNNGQTDTIYPTSGNIGLWVIVENPPKISIILTNTASITITSSPSGSGYVKVDGNPIITPDTFNWTTSSQHTLQALSPVTVGSTRYIWTGWSDGGAQNHTYTVPISNATITANWQAQFLVTFNYSVSGGGSGYSAPSVNYTSLGSQYSLTAGSTATVWVDSGSTYTYKNPLAGSSQSERWNASSGTSGTISSYTTINPTYHNQYYLTVSSSYGSPTGQGWYNAGSPASFGVTTPASGGTGTQYVFTSWSGSGSGSYSGTSSSSSVTMNNPITETANWQTQYQVTFGQSGLDSSASGTVVIVNGVPEPYNNLPYSLWVSSGNSVTYSYSATVSGSTGKRFALTGVTGPASPITVNNAVTVTGNYKTQWQVTFQQSGLSSDATGTVLTVGTNTYTYSTFPTGAIWVDDGTTYSYTSPVPAGTGKQYVLTGVTGPTSPIHSSATVKGNYEIQYYLTVNSLYSTTSGQGWYNATSSATFSISPTTVSGGAGIQYVFTGWTGTGAGSYSGSSSSHSVIMNNPITETANWQTQYQVTFAQSGLDSSATGTVVTVNGTAKTYGNLPYVTAWINSGGTVTYSYNNPVTSSTISKQFTLSSVSGSSSPITVNGPATITGNYVVQWQVTFTVSPSGSGTTSPSGTNVWENAGSLSISASANSGYQFSSWSATTGISITSPTSASTTATINATGTITATFTARTFRVDWAVNATSNTHNGATLTLPAVSANELIIVIYVQDHGHTFAPTDTDSLHWLQHGSQYYDSGQNVYIQEFWATTSSALSSGDQINPGESGSRNYGTVAIAFGISGANTASPFDSNYGSPSSGSGTTGAMSVAGATPSKSNDMILGLVGYTGTTTAVTAETSPYAFSLIQSVTYSATDYGGSFKVCAAAEDYVLPSTNTPTVAWGNSPSQSHWAMFVDAIQRAW